MLGYVSPRLYRGDTKRYDFRYVTLFVQFAFNGQSCEQRTPALLRMAGFSALVVPEETSITSPFGYKKKNNHSTTIKNAKFPWTSISQFLMHLFLFFNFFFFHSYLHLYSKYNHRECFDMLVLNYILIYWLCIQNVVSTKAFYFSGTYIKHPSIKVIKYY